MLGKGCRADPAPNLNMWDRLVPLRTYVNPNGPSTIIAGT